METFRTMVNDCLRIGLDAGASGFAALKPLCFARMLQYDLESSYRTSAIFEAGRVLEKYRTESRRGQPGRPYCRKAFLTASIGVWVDGDELVLPDKRRVGLNAHSVSILSQPGVTANSATITTYNLGICYKKTVSRIETLGAVALDINLENITTWDSQGSNQVFDLSSLIRLHETYRRVMSRFKRHDLRVRGVFLRKYGTLERNARKALLHNVSSAIVKRARDKRQAIVMENLTGLRGIFRKETGRSAQYLSKMNSWPFAELRRQIEYKAKWEGLPVILLEPQGTSNDCSRCGGGMKESATSHPTVVCGSCGFTIDRDLNAAKNILRLGLRSGQVGPASEAMGGTGRRKIESDAEVDAGQSIGGAE